ncbi:autotransporter domain-containing protein [Rahnella aceris]|uniref:autotransporter domain-containing protein n=1 Tax=Rahnella sp. (strain Y9602) TaxID=2703885 RepID=UPI001C278D33|nr:autotransporter domain-containing protein [Rahnella aceris]MBU9849217.1 autotransporter domain-containing protein [Rahnella aceris]
MSILTSAEKEKLPKECQASSGLTQTQWWIAGGTAAAVVAGIAIAAGGGGGGGGGDDNGGNTPVPPDDGGNTPVPPDDGGNTPVPPDDGGDTPVPPDDGGDTPVPPDDGGDTPVPPDDGGDTPVPPDDGGDTPVPPVDPVAQTTTYPNGLSITMIPGASTATLVLDGVSMDAVKQPDNTWIITDPATGKTYVAQTLDQATGAVTGYSIADRKTWTLDDSGKTHWTSVYSLINPEGSIITLDYFNDKAMNFSGSTLTLVENAGTMSWGDASWILSSGTWDIAQIKVGKNALFLNTGEMNFTMQTPQDFYRPDPAIVDEVLLSDGSGFINEGVMDFGGNNHMGGSIGMLDNATMVNHGQIAATGTNPSGSSGHYESIFSMGGASVGNTINWENAIDGVIVAGEGYNVISDAVGDFVDADTGGYIANTSAGVTINAVNDGVIEYSTGSQVDDTNPDTYSAVALGQNPADVSTFVNNGTMTVTGNGATAMSGQNNTTLVNNGTINLGSMDNTIEENGTGLVAFEAEGENVTAYNQGTVNINANDAYVFDRNGTTTARLVNTGTVNVRDGVTQWGMVKGEDASVVDTDTTSVYRSTVTNYTVGTTVDGGAGTMTVNHADLEDVTVDTGFTAGTDATTETFNDVFVGEDIQGVENVQSTSVVWTADAQTDESGNVDVTMTKNSYQDVVKDDAGMQDMAAELDANYTNNTLYNSLNLSTAAEVDNAMRQLSGANATAAFKEARVLSQRFTMLADNAIVMPSGFGFNLVDKNDKRAELGNDTRYDMMALSQSFDLSATQKVQVQYGIARLDGEGVDGKQKAGDNGLTGGYSQFFGLNHSMELSDGLMLTNALRYDIHQLESNRSISYTGVNQTADSDNSQQSLEWRSQFSKGFDVAEGLNLTPSAGLKMRHVANDAYSERGAGDFNLSMDASDETAVDALIGMKLKYASSNGWAVNALVEGGPNISYSQSGQTASLQGAGNARFNVDGEQKGGGINSAATVGVSYSGKSGHLAFDAYQWKEDNVSDKGILMNYKYAF